MRCDRCVLNFDHHCKFLNNCIGSANYKHFCWLIFFVQLFELYMTAVTIYCIVHNETKQMRDFSLFVALGKSVGIAVVNGYLIAFHIYLEFKGLSTIEYIGKKQQAELDIAKAIKDLKLNETTAEVNKIQNFTSKTEI